MSGQGKHSFGWYFVLAIMGGVIFPSMPVQGSADAYVAVLDISTTFHGARGIEIRTNTVSVTFSRCQSRIIASPPGDKLIAHSECGFANTYSYEFWKLDPNDPRIGDKELEAPTIGPKYPRVWNNSELQLFPSKAPLPQRIEYKIGWLALVCEARRKNALKVAV